MVISDIKDQLLEIASRRLFEFGERDPAYNQYKALLKSHGLAAEPARKINIPIRDKHPKLNITGCPEQSCLAKGVADLLWRRPRLFTFEEACGILAHCNQIRHKNFIEDTIRSYAIVIVGLQGFAEEDLHLAVYFFLEDMFGIQVNMELCVRLTSDKFRKNVIGVVFDKITVKETIVKKLAILDDSGIVIDVNFDTKWIFNKFCEDKAGD